MGQPSWPCRSSLRFEKYIFIERSAERCLELEKMKQEFPELAADIDVRQGDANEVIQQLCAPIDGWKSRRAVLFLDPYGMQVDWETIQNVAATKAIDLWLLVRTSCASPSAMRTVKTSRCASPITCSRTSADGAF
jgi:three-Cys-motif partner protein